MAAGLSGIVDTIDQTMDGHRCVFTKDELKAVCAYCSAAIIMSTSTIKDFPVDYGDNFVLQSAFKQIWSFLAKNFFLVSAHNLLLMKPPMKNYIYFMSFWTP